MATRCDTHPVAASLLPGSNARWATRAKMTRSTASPSNLRRLATRRIAAPIPNRSHNRSNVQDPPTRRESRTSPSTPSATAPPPGVGPPEAVDHLRYRGPPARVPLVVGELQVGHHRPVPVRPPRLPQIHAYTKSRLRAPCRATRHKSCAYTISPITDPRKPLTRPDTLRKSRICLRTAEVRSKAAVTSALVISRR